jgi:hypothetical protein
MYLRFYHYFPAQYLHLPFAFQRIESIPSGHKYVAEKAVLQRRDAQIRKCIQLSLEAAMFFMFSLKIANIFLAINSGKATRSTIEPQPRA